FFFFSSRRRHTRSDRDWSSDVCSSDLVKSADRATVRAMLQQHVDVNAGEPDGTTALHWAARADDVQTAELLIAAGANVKITNRRSEERRVGKECRYRWWREY